MLMMLRLLRCPMLLLVLQLRLRWRLLLRFWTFQTHPDLQTTKERK